MKELEKTARELILSITEKTLKTLKDKGLLKEPSQLQMLCSSPEMKSLIKKLSAPKYDPCRLFKEGDEVELKTNLGRNPYDPFDGQEYIPDDTIFTVLRDEWVDGKVDIFEKDKSDAFTVHFSNLELVTPVEELERYFIEHDSTGFAIVDRKNVGYVAHFKEVQHPHAKAAAEAERNRLNAEYRKEQEK